VTQRVSHYVARILDTSIPPCNGHENMIHILLKANETQSRKEQLLDNKCLLINEELAYMEIISCNNIMELKNR